MRSWTQELQTAFNIIHATEHLGRTRGDRDKVVRFLAQAAANYRSRTYRWPSEKGLAKETDYTLSGIKSMKKQRGGTRIGKEVIQDLALTLRPGLLPPLDGTDYER